MRLAARAALAAFAIASGACSAGAHSPLRARPGEADARVIRYADDNDLAVTTYVARVEQPVGDGSSVFARGTADHVVLRPKQLHAPHTTGNQPTGHRDADVVTSASSTAGQSAGADEWRYEGVLGGQVGLGPASAPKAVRALVRASTEPDYASLAAQARFTTELARRNATLSVFAGAGRDVVTPLEAPPGQASAWPASHARLTYGASIAQIASRRVLVSAGLGVTHQRGQLASPYRRAIVKTSLFPESLPDARDRATLFAASSMHVGWQSAVHLRAGLYADSWGVVGFVPEVQLAKSFGRRLLTSLRYRFVGQGRADFYEPAYATVAPILSGDPRLGALREHAVGALARLTFLGDPSGFGSLGAFAELELAWLEYRAVQTTLASTVSSVGLALTY